MLLDDYQKEALSTAQYPEWTKIIYPALGITGAAGEVSDKVKKVLRDNDGEFSADKKAEIAKELRDVLWYCATLAHDLGYNLDTIAQMNIDKLKSRKERGKISGSGDNR